MPRDAQQTRSQLIRAAEQLFASRGVEAVSLREINREADQKNATALQYHFSNRAGLIRAILEKHEPGVEADRHAFLDGLSVSQAADLRTLVRALVEPAAAKLADRDGGREYLQIIGELMNRPVVHFSRESLEDQTTSINRWRMRVTPLIPEVAADRLHRRFSVLRIMWGELARRAEGPRRRDDRLFTSQLVDMLTGGLGAPVSPETEALLSERGRS